MAVLITILDDKVKYQSHVFSGTAISQLGAVLARFHTQRQNMVNTLIPANAGLADDYEDDLSAETPLQGSHIVNVTAAGFVIWPVDPMDKRYYILVDDGVEILPLPANASRARG